MLYSNKLFILGNNSNKYKEEVDNKSNRELNTFQKLLLDKYKDNTQYQKALATAKVEENREINFFRFSNSNNKQILLAKDFIRLAYNYS